MGRCYTGVTADLPRGPPPYASTREGLLEASRKNNDWPVRFWSGKRLHENHIRCDSPGKIKVKAKAGSRAKKPRNSPLDRTPKTRILELNLYYEATRDLRRPTAISRPFASRSESNPCCYRKKEWIWRFRSLRSGARRGARMRRAPNPSFPTFRPRPPVAAPNPVAARKLCISQTRRRNNLHSGPVAANPSFLAGRTRAGNQRPRGHDSWSRRFLFLFGAVIPSTSMNFWASWLHRKENPWAGSARTAGNTEMCSIPWPGSLLGDPPRLRRLRRSATIGPPIPGEEIRPRTDPAKLLIYPPT